MNETVRFLLIVGSIYVCHVANSYLAETLYTSPPHKIDVRWIGLIFEGVWSIIFAEVYRMVSKAYDGYGAKRPRVELKTVRRMVPEVNLRHLIATALMSQELSNTPRAKPRAKPYVCTSFPRSCASGFGAKMGAVSDRLRDSARSRQGILSSGTEIRLLHNLYGLQIL